MIIRGGSPEIEPLTILWTIFHEKGTPFVYPFHVTSLELCIHFNCCKCNVFLMGINRKNRKFSRLSRFLEIYPLALLALSQIQMTDFPIPLFYILQLVRSLPFRIPEAKKRYPFRAEPPRIGHQREYPPGT